MGKGGKRPGAGRPSHDEYLFPGKHVYTFRLLPALIERVDDFKVARGLADRTKALETMIEEYSFLCRSKSEVVPVRKPV